MDSYIVRVYRRSGEAGREVSGLVERVGNGGRKAFSNSDDLWRFIAGRTSGQSTPVKLGTRGKKARGK